MRLSRSARSTVRDDVGAERHDLEADRLALAREPLEQLGRFERLDDREHVMPLRRPSTRPPTPNRRGAAARGSRPCPRRAPSVDVLVAVDRRSAASTAPRRTSAGSRKISSQ